ncbi:hypothetical protein AZA_83733 [Nitrospirillum viridazoti Y2]|nr:hypothetical protein AZA_83733 [Nitrospirillum amazonense Y2]
MGADAAQRAQGAAGDQAARQAGDGQGLAVGPHHRQGAQRLERRRQVHQAVAVGVVHAFGAHVGGRGEQHGGGGAVAV